MSELAFEMDNSPPRKDTVRALGVRGFAQAACLEYDPELFFPAQEMQHNKPTKAAMEAIEVCVGCVAREQCLELALENDERFGIWAGKTSDERRKIIARRRRNRV